MIEQLAYSFAAGAHGAIAQKRKYTGEPYIVHPKRVALLVKDRGAKPATIAAAYLHDVVEDTEITIRDIKREFGSWVGLLVGHLTNVPLSAGNRAKRFELNLQKLAAAPVEAKTIKIADLIDNTSTIVIHDPKFAKVYLAEKRATLDVLRGGDQVLWDMAVNLCKDGLESLAKGGK